MSASSAHGITYCGSPFARMFAKVALVFARVLFIRMTPKQTKVLAKKLAVNVDPGIHAKIVRMVPHTHAGMKINRHYS